MTIDDLAAHDAADRARILARALADERRGRAIKAAQGGRTDAFDANIARLESEAACMGRTAA